MAKKKGGRKRPNRRGGKRATKKRKRKKLAAAAAAAATERAVATATTVAAAATAETVAVVTAAVIGIGTGLYAAYSSFDNAAKEKEAAEKADAEAKRLMSDAKKKAEKDYYEGLAVPLDAYDAEFENLLAVKLTMRRCNDKFEEKKVLIIKNK